MELGKYLKEARERKNYSLREVQELLKNKGISYTFTNIKRMEDGDNNKVPIKVLAGLSEIYSIDKMNILNMAGANISLEDKEQFELNEFLAKGSLFFNDENISEDDKRKVIDALQEMFYISKLKK